MVDIKSSMNGRRLLLGILGFAAEQKFPSCLTECLFDLCVLNNIDQPPLSPDFLYQKLHPNNEFIYIRKLLREM